MKLTSFASAFSGIKHVALVALSAGLITSAWAKPVPANLGYGLDKLVESDLMLKAGGANKGMQLYNGYATQQAAAYAERAITNADGRFKVDITLSGKVTLEELRVRCNRSSLRSKLHRLIRRIAALASLKAGCRWRRALPSRKCPGLDRYFWPSNLA